MRSGTLIASSLPLIGMLRLYPQFILLPKATSGVCTRNPSNALGLPEQGLQSQDLETGQLFLGVLIFKGDYNILRLPFTCIYF